MQEGMPMCEGKGLGKSGHFIRLPFPVLPSVPVLASSVLFPPLTLWPVL